MEKLTAILSQEHQKILQVIDALCREASAVRAGRPLRKEFFARAVDFIRNYADKFHHAKEEDLLFRELGKNEEAMPCNPLPQMLHEHELGRGFVRNLKQGLKRNDLQVILEAVQGYTQLLREHIFKEDNILYPMSDQALGPSTQKSLLQRALKVKSAWDDGKINSLVQEVR